MTGCPSPIRPVWRQMDIHILAILAVAMVIAIGVRQIHLPYTVGLVVVGAVLAVSPIDFGMALTHDFIFQVILPPLLFEAAITLSWAELRRDLLPILVLSTLGTVIAAAAVAAGMVLLLHWPLGSSLIFGALIAATDPVAVIAMFKDNGVKGRLRLLVESESLFNDGVAAVLFTAMLAWAEAGSSDPYMAMIALALSIAGGIVIGLLCGAIAIAVAGGTSEHLVEAALTMVAAYGSFVLAEHLQVSGVLATVAAGLLMGNLGALREPEQSPLSLKGREFVLAFWEFAAFLANSIVFPLIGVSIAGLGLNALGTVSLLAAIAIVLASRALTVYPLSLSFRWSKRAIPLEQQHVLWWGGLRGALALALALALPPTLAFRNEIVVTTFGVVAFSIVIQGVTMPLLLRRLGIRGAP
jgi:monovalent cation:H+ antiporter, CPA1 family